MPQLEPSERSHSARQPKRNNNKCAVYRHFLLSTFGREKMCSGAGVLDVAGGQSGLAWELINYDRVPATVVDPRPSVRARRFERRYAHRRRDDERAEAEPPRHWPVYWRDDVWRPALSGEPSADALAALTAALNAKPPQANSARRTRKGYFDEGDGDEATTDATATPPPPSSK